MGTLSDVFDFESFNLKDMWNKVRDDPERLLYGSVDPFSTEMWNQITGSDHEPMVNMLGGPMGSGWTGLGEDGGVYQRARDEGINTEWSGKSHDVAEMIAAYYGGSGAGDALGGLFSLGGAGGGAAGGGAGGAGGVGGGLGAGAPAGIETVTVVGSSGGSGAGLGAAGGAAAGNSSGESEEGFDWMDQLENLGSNNQQQQQKKKPVYEPPELASPEFDQAWAFSLNEDEEKNRRARRRRMLAGSL